MFGTYRWVLAALVANTHLGFSHHLGGATAVFGFYVLSGYLMTLMIVEHYGTGLKGARLFYLNRVFRIFPLYWLGLIFAAVFIRAFPHALYPDSMAWPDTPWKWFANITLIGVEDIRTGEMLRERLLSVSWSLLPELIFYLLLPVFLLNRYLYRLWLLISAYLLADDIIGDHDFMHRYLSIYGWAPPFAIGSSLYFLRRKGRAMPHWLAAPVMIAFFALSIFPYDLWGAGAAYQGYYCVLALNALIIYYLSFQSTPDARIGRIDNALGQMAYPMFVMHLIVGGVVRVIAGPSLPIYTVPFYGVCLLAASLLAYALYRLVDAPITRWRRQLQ